MLDCCVRCPKVLRPEDPSILFPDNALPHGDEDQVDQRQDHLNAHANVRTWDHTSRAISARSGVATLLFQVVHFFGGSALLLTEEVGEARRIHDSRVDRVQVDGAVGGRARQLPKGQCLADLRVCVYIQYTERRFVLRCPECSGSWPGNMRSRDWRQAALRYVTLAETEQ